jgi:hypothetical protein
MKGYLTEFSIRTLIHKMFVQFMFSPQRDSSESCRTDMACFRLAIDHSCDLLMSAFIRLPKMLKQVAVAGEYSITKRTLTYRSIVYEPGQR